MKAQLKVNYSEAKKGEVFNVVDFFGKRVTVEINGRNVDFGISEVQIVAPTNSDLKYLGHELLLMGKKSIAGWRETDVTKFMSQIAVPIKKSLIRRSINSAIWG